MKLLGRWNANFLTYILRSPTSYHLLTVMDQNNYRGGNRNFQRRGRGNDWRGFGGPPGDSGGFGGPPGGFGGPKDRGFPQGGFHANDSGHRRGNFRQDRRGGHPRRGRNNEEHRSGSRERPPPELKGREIGMWYAKRSQAKKEREQTFNRPTVSMDKDKERNIRHLLHNLKQGDGGEGGGAGIEGGWGREASQAGPSSSGSSQGASYFQDAKSPEFKHPGNQFGGKESFYSPESNTRFVYTDEDKKVLQASQEPCESWEELCTSDNDQDQEASQNEQLVQAAAPVVTPTVLDDVIDLEDFDDEGKDAILSVSGVMEYMSEHSDYPYRAEEETDFEPVRSRQGNPDLDKKMLDEMESLQSNSNFLKMREFRQKLPSYDMREIIVNTVNGSQVVVISGETGCGKTTQVPQFILDDYIQRGVGSQCSVICTQPRRISAISVAERVAAERCERVNTTGHNSIGYQIRLETKRPRTQGSILFCTTGIVLKFLEGDPKLERATHVIIDEIHERDLQSDFLMIILKDLLPRRSDLKVILMSATLNAEMFSQYFNNCPMLNIPGYTFPVREYVLEEILELTNYTSQSSGGNVRRRPRGKRRKPEEIEMEENYQVWCRNQVGKYNHHTVQMLQDFDFQTIDLDLILHIIQHIVTKMEDGAILVFVPGWEEIKKLNEMIQKNMRSRLGTLRVIPLHSLMPTVNQREVFDRPPPGVRKIVIATNIAETSITIDDVVFVIDCGKIKVKDFQPEMNLTSLEAQWVSKANAKQRRGRAGRVQAGYCFHLYTEFHYQMAQDYLLPEMLRTRLEELCLQIKLLKLGYIVPFISKAMQHPSMEAIQHAIETLTELSALDSDENLLPLGYHLARMPVEPHTAKMILFGAMFGCLDPILTVAASLSFKDAFVIPLGKEDMADKARKNLANGTKSDHIMLINAFQGWEKSLSQRRNGEYCWQNFLSENTLKLLRDMKRQLAELLSDTGFIASKDPKDPKANINSGNQSMLRAIICAGLYPNVAQIARVPKARQSRNQNVTMYLKDKTKVCAHPKSVNMAETFFESKWMVFYTKLKTSKIYLHDSTMVSPYPLLFFGGKIGFQNNNGLELVTVDDWMAFKASHSTAVLVKELRAQLDGVLLEKITRPGPTSWDRKDKEGAIMAAISDLLTTEQVGRGFQDDGSIGNPNL